MCRNDLPAAPARAPATLAAARRRLSSRDLLGREQEVVIEHEGCEYVLRLTRQNKLILTK
jgi:hemin uptake protein HemP